MPQNIDATTRTIGLWLLAHKEEKHVSTFEVTSEFPNVARPRVSEVLSRFTREGYLSRISRGFYRVVPDNVMDFERRLKPSAKEIEVVAAIPTDEFRIDVHLNSHALNLNTLLVVGVADLHENEFIMLLNFLESYAKSILGMVKYARTNLESFPSESSMTDDDVLRVKQYLKEKYN